MVPNFKYQCVLDMDAIRQFRLIVDGNANVIRMAYDDEVYRTATIDLLSNLARIDDDGCAVIKELTKTQMALVENFIKHELKVSKKELGATHLAKHTIDVGDHPPIKQKYHVRYPAVMDEMNKLMDKLIEQKLVEPSNSAWSSPVLMARKSNGTYRLCIDFREISRVTKKDAYPLPPVTNILDKLQRAYYISTINLDQAFHQVPLDEKSKELTAFTVSGRGLSQFTRMPFGLANAPAKFERLIDKVIGPELEPYAFAYLGDVIIVSETFEDHLKWLKEV